MMRKSHLLTEIIFQGKHLFLIAHNPKKDCEMFTVFSFLL